MFISMCFVKNVCGFMLFYVGFSCWLMLFCCIVCSNVLVLCVLSVVNG